MSMIGPWEFEQRMRAIIARTRDPEVQHSDADDLMTETLEALGYSLADYHALTRWFA